MGPYHLYRQTEWFRHDHEYEKDPYEHLSRGFLGLSAKTSKWTPFLGSYIFCTVGLIKLFD